MPSIRISRLAVDSAEPAATTKLFWDDRLRGFGLKVEPSGTKSYLVQYRMGGRDTPTRRYTIGRHGSPWTPVTARSEAERLLRLAASGIDPQEAAKAQTRINRDFAFDRYAEKFLRDYGRRNWRPRTWASAESNMRRWVVPVLGRKPITKIRRSDLIAIFDRLPDTSPALARSIFALLRKLFVWAHERDDVERSPFDGFKSPPAVPSRDRVLSDAELMAILLATVDLGKPFDLLVRLLMVTGQRRNEVALMQWDELDRDAALWSLPGDRTKNGLPHQVPLSPLFINQLDSFSGGRSWPAKGLVFTTTGNTAVSGYSRMKRRLDKLACKWNDGNPLPDWRLHDLRRTMATGLQRLGVRFEVTEALLNHVSGARSGIAGVYQRHEWREEKRAAINSWTDHLLRITENAYSQSNRAAEDMP